MTSLASKLGKFERLWRAWFFSILVASPFEFFRDFLVEFSFLFFLFFFVPSFSPRSLNSSLLFPPDCKNKNRKTPLDLSFFLLSFAFLVFPFRFHDDGEGAHHLRRNYRLDFGRLVFGSLVFACLLLCLFWRRCWFRESTAVRFKRVHDTRGKNSAAEQNANLVLALQGVPAPADHVDLLC